MEASLKTAHKCLGERAPVKAVQGEESPAFTAGAGRVCPASAAISRQSFTMQGKGHGPSHSRQMKPRNCSWGFFLQDSMSLIRYHASCILRRSPRIRIAPRHKIPAKRPCSISGCSTCRSTPRTHRSICSAPARRNFQESFSVVTTASTSFRILRIRSISRKVYQ